MMVQQQHKPHEKMIKVISRPGLCHMSPLLVGFVFCNSRVVPPLRGNAAAASKSAVKLTKQDQVLVVILGVVEQYCVFVVGP
jgi:hypothetical protein